MPSKSQIVYKGGKFESVSDLARYLKIKPSTLHTRIAKGVPPDQWGMKSYSNSNFYTQSDPQLKIDQSPDIAEC